MVDARSKQIVTLQMQCLRGSPLKTCSFPSAPPPSGVCMTFDYCCKRPRSWFLQTSTTPSNGKQLSPIFSLTHLDRRVRLVVGVIRPPESCLVLWLRLDGVGVAAHEQLGAQGNGKLGGSGDFLLV